MRKQTSIQQMIWKQLNIKRQVLILTSEAFTKKKNICFIDLNLKAKIIKLLKANIEKHFHDIGISKDFLGY